MKIKFWFVLTTIMIISIDATTQQIGSFTDARDGNSYKTIIIGDKIWMTENLNFNMDDKGSYYYPKRMLNLDKAKIEEALLFYHIDKKSIVGLTGLELLEKFNPYLKTVVRKYSKGWRYYDYNAATIACPMGWRLPSKEDWMELKTLSNEQFALLKFDSIGHLVLRNNNPILDIRLGDYFGDSRDCMFFTSSETAENFFIAEIYHPNVFINNIKKGDGLDTYRGGTCIRCVKNLIKAQEKSSFTDLRDGKTYKTVKIGTQTWMAENLAYKASSDCWAYHNDTSMVSEYGYLYNCETAKNGCPAGWHLPSDDEWATLIMYLGGESVAGGKLKETGITHWLNPNKGATNETGFTAFPGGDHYIDGKFSSIRQTGGWWSSTIDGSMAWLRMLYYNYSFISRNAAIKEVGFSVRCVKNN